MFLLSYARRSTAKGRGRSSYRPFAAAICTFIALCLLRGLPSALAAETVKLSNGEWPPYTSETLEDYGTFSHIVSEAFALEGIKTVYAFFPWKRAYLVAKEGQFDGSVTWAPTPERKRDFYFSDPVVFSRKVFFHLKALPLNWQTIDDLKSLRIGATTQYTYGEAFDQAAQAGILNIEYVSRDILNIKKLLRHRIDIFPMEIEVGYTLIRTEASAAEAALVTHHPQPIQKTPVCVVISRNSDEQRAQRLLTAFNRGLRRLRRSGRYDELLQGIRQSHDSAER